VRRWEPSPGAAALSCDFRTFQVYPKDLRAPSEVEHGLPSGTRCASLAPAQSTPEGEVARTARHRPQLGRAGLHPDSLPVCLQGRLGAPLQVHRGLHGFDALASRSDGLIERGLKPLIGFDQSGNRVAVISLGPTLCS